MGVDIQFEHNGAPYIIWGDSKVQLENWPLDGKLYKEKAEIELRETPENVEQGLRELKELLKGEESLKVPIDDDDFLMRFLRPCKFYAESAFKKMKAYYKFRQANPNYCRDMVPSAVHASIDRSIVSFFAPRDQHGRRIMFIQSRSWNPREVPLTEVFRGMQLALETGMNEPLTQVCGVTIVLDMKGLSLNHVMQITPSFAKLVLDWVQECLPMRLKAVHIVNQPYVFKMVFAVFKPFLREKLRSRIFFHGSDMESLKQHIDGSVLRPHLGGSLPEMEITGEVVLKILSYNEDVFIRTNGYGYVDN